MANRKEGHIDASGWSELFLIVSVSPEIEKRLLMSLPMPPGKRGLSRCWVTIPFPASTV
jgi:hypothetical protein